jgi:hypothetical protein
MKLPSLASLDAAPEFPLGSNDKVLVERIGMDLDLHLLAAAGDYGEHRRLRPERRDCCAGNYMTKPIGQAGFLGRSILIGYISVSTTMLAS